MTRVPALLLALILMLSCFTGCDSGEKPSETTATTAVPSFSASISGDALCDSKVTGEVAADAGSIVSCQWYLDGKPLYGAVEKTLHVPVTAGGKTLKFTAVTKNGVAESEEITVTGTESETRSMAGIFHDVKIIGRCIIQDTSVTADFSGCGFEANLKINSGDVKLSFQAHQNLYLAVYVDGKLADRPCFDAGERTLTIKVPTGEHTVKVLKETEVTTAGPSLTLNSLTFDGDILERPADKELFIEYIGDSIVCGDGALGKYTAGKVWELQDHSATNSFAYFSAETLDADFSLFARGGIGLIKPAGDYTMGDLYYRANLYRDNSPYTYPRTPDIIVIKLGSNDGVSDLPAFKQALEQFIELIRMIHGSEPVLIWTGKETQHYNIAQEIIDAKSGEDDKLYAFQFAYGGSGSAALATQTAGHPDAAEQKAYGDALVQFLRDNNLV